MLTSLLHIIFVIAWAVLAFEVIRSVLALWRQTRQLARFIAVAVAGAFALGATGPLALSVFQPASVAPAAVTPAAPPAVASTGKSVACPPAARLSAHHSAGYIDSLQSGATQFGPDRTKIQLAAGSLLLVSGWAALSTGPGIGICPIVDGHPAPDAALVYGIVRPDVAAATNLPANGTTGYSISIKLSAGTHRLGMGVLEGDGLTIDPIASVVQVDVR